MWVSGTRLANAWPPGCRGRRARHLAAVVPFAGSATLPWGQVSSNWKPNAIQASHGFFRSYALESMPKTGTSSLEDLSQSPAHDDSQNPSTDDARISDSTEQAADREHRIPRNPPRLSRLKYGSSHLRFKGVLGELNGVDWPPPGARDDNAAPWHQTDNRSQAGHAPVSESITIRFQPDDSGLYNGFGPSSGPMKLSKLYLRDICQCSRCVCPSTGLKTFATCDIPDVPRMRAPEVHKVMLAAGESLEITWQDDFLTGGDHTSVYSHEFLKSLESPYTQTNYYARPSQELWNKTRFEHDMLSRAIAYGDWMEEGTKFAQAVYNLYAYGLVFMRGVDSSWYSVVKIAERLGNLQYTAHGLTWDDISGPGGTDAACSDVRLHQDALHSHEQPQIQFMHCLENGLRDNLYLFSDGLRSAYKLRSWDRHSFSALSTQLVDYSYRKGGQFFSTRRRVIQMKSGRPVSIAWSPAFQGPFRRNDRNETNRHGFDKGPDDGTLRDWSKAARAFRDQVESPLNVVAYRLQPGECVIFDSRRVLYGMKQLAIPAGHKHLRVAYVNSETLSSAFSRLFQKGLLEKLPGGTVLPPGHFGTLGQ